MSYLEAVAYRQDGGFALAGSSLTGNIWDGSLWYFDSWDQYTNTPNLELDSTPTTTGHSQIAWFNQSKLIVAADSGDLEVWYTVAPGNALECAAPLSGAHHDMVLSLCVTGEGESGRVISGGGAGYIAVWDVLAVKRLNCYRAHGGWVTDIDHHPSQMNVFISTSMDKQLKIWDTRQSCPVTMSFVAPCDAYCQSLSWSPFEDSMIVSGNEAGFLHLHDMRYLKEPVLSSHIHSLSIHRLSFSRLTQGLVVTVSDDFSVKLFHIPSRSVVLSDETHKDFVHGLSWHPDSSLFLTCSWDGTVHKHDLSDLTLPEQHSFATDSTVDWTEDIETEMEREYSSSAKEEDEEGKEDKSDSSTLQPPEKQVAIGTAVANGVQSNSEQFYCDLMTTSTACDTTINI